MLQVGERAQSSTNPSLGVLHISDITLSESGEYECRATYLGIGTLTSYPARLAVLGFGAQISDMTLTTGELLVG